MSFAKDAEKEQLIIANSAGSALKETQSTQCHSQRAQRKITETHRGLHVNKAKLISALILFFFQNNCASPSGYGLCVKSKRKGHEVFRKGRKGEATNHCGLCGFSAGSALKRNAKDAMSFAKDAEKEQLIIADSAGFLCGLCVKK